MAQLKGKYIEDGAVTLAKMADMATDSFIGRDTAGSGVPEVLSAATARGILNVEDGADVTDATNVDNAGAVMEADYDANTMMIATDDNTPVASNATAVRSFLNVEDGADVTDEANVTDALDGATLSAATVASDDKVLIQDTNDNDVLKTVTVASIVALGTGSTRIVEIVTLDATDISNKYNDDLTQVPTEASTVSITPVGGIPQEYTVDFTVVTDGADIKRINWDGLGLESLLAEGDKLIVTYEY